MAGTTWARRGAAAAAAIAALAAAPAASAAPQELDKSFSGDGWTITRAHRTDSRAQAVLVQPDGKIVAAGDGLRNDFVALTRHQPDGSLDTAFGSGGIAHTTLDGTVDIHAVERQGDGKILAVGSLLSSVPGSTSGEVQSDVLIVRYLPDGSLDPSFGSGGVLPLDLGANEWASDVVLQPGRIVIVGERDTDRYDMVGGGTNPSRFLLAGLTAAGTLDPGFGQGGWTATEVAPGRVASATHAAIQGDRILALGTLRGQYPDYDLAIVRYTRDGALDTSFGRGGAAIETIRDPDYPAGIGVQRDGSIIVGSSPAHIQFAFMRLTPGGRVDSSFAGGGKWITDPSTNHDDLEAIVVQPDDRIVGVGTGGGGGDFVVVRYRADGTFDPSFAGNGIELTQLAGADKAEAVALQPDGRIVLAGWSGAQYGGHDGFALARYLPGGSAESTVSLAVRKTGRRMKVKGVVEPPLKISVLVTLARRKGPRFKQVAKKRVRSDASGRYSATLPRARRGKCRISVRFRSAAGAKQTKKVRNLSC